MRIIVNGKMDRGVKLFLQKNGHTGLLAYGLAAQRKSKFNPIQHYDRLVAAIKKARHRHA